MYKMIEKTGGMYTTYITTVLRAAWKFKTKLTVHLDLINVCFDFVRHGAILEKALIVHDLVRIEDCLDLRLG